MVKEYREFDFREIAELDDSAKSLRDWVSKSASFFNDFWQNISDFGVQLSVSGMATLTYEGALKNADRTYYSCNLQLNADTGAQWWVDAGELRAVAREMLCLPAATEEKESSEPVELTTVESRVAELFLSEVGASLERGWMGNRALDVEVSTLDRDPLKSRIFRASDLVSSTCLGIESNNSNARIHWVSPRQDLVYLLDSIRDSRAETTPSALSSPDPQLVKQAQFEVATVLGRASLPMLDIANLSEGQLIRLDQRIDTPLQVYVNDQPAYRAWPGKRGNQQALEIEGSIEL